MSLGEKAVRKLWRLPYTTLCNLLHTINNSLPIEIELEKRSIKSIWSCVNSENNATFCFWPELQIFFI